MGMKKDSNSEFQVTLYIKDINEALFIKYQLGECSIFLASMFSNNNNAL